jgi:hypothetical protein
MLFVGLILGVGGAVAKERLNSGFITPQQIEQVLELPLLASVHRMGKSDTTINGKITPIAILPVAMPRSRFSEEVRLLRNGIPQHLIFSVFAINAVLSICYLIPPAR